MQIFYAFIGTSCLIVLIGIYNYLKYEQHKNK